MFAKFSHIKRNPERSTWHNSSSREDDHSQASLMRKKHRLLQVREHGGLPTQGRQNQQQHQSHQLQRLAEELRAGWLEAPNKLARALEGLYLAYMLGARGCRTEPSVQVLEGPAQRGAGGPRKAGEKHKVKDEKGRREELSRQQSYNKPQRKAGGPPYSAPHAPDKRKGKRVPTTKANSRRLSDPSSAAGDVSHHQGKGKEKFEKEWPREGRKQLTKGTVGSVRDLKDNCPGLSGEVWPRKLEQVWPEGSSSKQRAVPPPAPVCRRGEKSKWQRELEMAFKELFDTNQKLKRHLSLHLGGKPGESQPSGEEQSSLELSDPRVEARGGKRADKAEGTLTRVSTSSSGDHALQIASTANLKPLLGTFQNPKCHSTSTPTYRNETLSSSSDSGMSLRANNPQPCRLEPQQELPESDTLTESTFQLPLHEQTHRVRLMAMKQMQKMEMEQRRWKQLEMLDENEYLRMNLEAPSQNEAEELREQVSGHLGLLKMCSSLEPLEERKERGHSSMTPSITSIYDDERHSQMLQDLQQQILEQNKLHKKFIEETRKRLQEFQTIR